MARNFFEQLYHEEETMGIEEVLSHVPRKVLDDMNMLLSKP